MAVTVAPAGSGESCPIPYVVLLTGLPAAGKTTVGRPLAARLRLPDIRSDTIKEAIFDSTDSRSPAWSDFLKLVSKQTGTYLDDTILEPSAVYALNWSEFLTVVAKNISFGLLPQVGPCVLDVFMPRNEAAERLVPLVGRVIEIHCSVSYELAWNRFTERARSGRRHPGHKDAEVSFGFFRETLAPQQVDRPFRFGDAVLVLDTSQDVDLDYVCDWVTGQTGRP
jgi:hypothetical protein